MGRHLHPACARLLAVALLVGAACRPLPAGAAGAPPSSDLPDLAPVRARIYAGEFAEASAELLALSRTTQHAEVYNLLGYSLRQLRRHDEAAHWYREALTYDPAHRPALEYQGELFIALGDFDAARRNLRYLQLLCAGQGCVEYDKLAQALREASRAPAP